MSLETGPGSVRLTLFETHKPTRHLMTAAGSLRLPYRHMQEKHIPSEFWSTQVKQQELLLTFLQHICATIANGAYVALDLWNFTPK